MNENEAFRDHIVKLLDGRQAHVDLESVFSSFPSELQGAKPHGEGGPYTPWQLLEHMRIAQWDILEFSRSAEHVSPDYPEGYWPASEAPPSAGAWEEDVSSFQTDLQSMKSLVADPSTDLCRPIPHGSGQTILREAMLVADHNAYHLGQIVLLRRLMAVDPGSK